MTLRDERQTRRAGRATGAWERLGRGLGRLLQSPAPSSPVAGSRPWSPDLRVFDKRRELVLELVSRQIDPRKIRIQLVGNTLTLSGATLDLHPDHHGYHAFRRKVVLPTTVDSRHISARAHGNRLTVRLGKRRPPGGAPLARPRGFPATVAGVMTRDVLSVAPQMTVQDAAELLGSFNIGSVPVCQGRKVLGVLTDRDIAIRVTAKALDPAQVKVQDVMTPNPLTCSFEDSLADAEEVMADAQIRRLPVVDPDGNLVGYLSLAKIAQNDHEARAGHLLRGVSEPGVPKVLRSPPSAPRPPAAP